MNYKKPYSACYLDPRPLFLIQDGEGITMPQEDLLCRQTTYFTSLLEESEPGNDITLLAQKCYSGTFGIKGSRLFGLGLYERINHVRIPQPCRK